MLDHCRRTGTWILADEVYERLFFGGWRRLCAVSFLDIATARRPAGGGAQLLQELPDDRLAPGLAGAARRPPGRAHGQADRVQHLLRAGVRAARRPGGAGAWPTRSRRVWCAPAGLPRPLVPGCCRRCPACWWRRPRAACTPSSAPRARTTRWPGQAPGGRGTAWAWRRARPSGPEAEGWLRWCFASRDRAGWTRAWTGWRRWL
jgi:hypothetical protein